MAPLVNRYIKSGNNIGQDGHGLDHLVGTSIAVFSNQADLIILRIHVVAVDKHMSLRICQRCGDHGPVPEIPCK